MFEIVRYEIKINEQITQIDQGIIVLFVGRLNIMLWV